jgi:hypothetical protein
MSSTTSGWGTTLISVFFGALFLLTIYLWFEAREEDAEGNKVFSPQKLGIILRNMFGYCCPDAILIFVSNICICCGFVGNSCLDQIQADEEIRETKRLARLAANLSKKSTKPKKKKPKSRKVEHDFEAISSSEDEFDLEAGSSDSVGSNGSGRKERSRPMKLTSQKSPINYPSHSVRGSTSHGLDHHNDRSERGMVMSSSIDLQETNISQQIVPQMESEFQEDESLAPSDYSVGSNGLESTSSSQSISSQEEEQVIQLSSQHPLIQLSDSSSHSKDSQKNSILANHFIAKEFLERHIAIEDQLLAEQTSSFSFFSLTSPSPPHPPSKPLSSVY